MRSGGSWGGFAPEYFAYHEDTELSLRLWQRGLSIEFVPDAVVRHHYEFSRNDFKHYLLERNRLMVIYTTYQWRSLVVLAPMFALTELAMLVAATLGGWLRPKLRGYGWLWRNRRWVRARRRQLQRELNCPRLDDHHDDDSHDRGRQHRSTTRHRDLQRDLQRILGVGASPDLNKGVTGLISLLFRSSRPPLGGGVFRRLVIVATAAAPDPCQDFHDQACGS